MKKTEPKENTATLNLKTNTTKCCLGKQTMLNYLVQQFTTWFACWMPRDQAGRNKCGKQKVLRLWGLCIWFSDVHRPVKQEVAVQYTANIYIPSKHSPPLRTHSSSPLHQDSKAFWQSEEDNEWNSESTAFARSSVQENFHPANFSLMRGNNRSHMEPSGDCMVEGPEQGCLALLGGWQWPWLWGLCSASGSILSRHSWFFIMPNDHISDEVNTILFMVVK